MDTKRSAANAVNLLALAVLAGLGAVAVVMTILLGPFGLVILGLLTLLVCSQFTLDEHAPTWGARVFAARMAAGGSPEDRAAAAEARRAALAPIRFYRWCGLFLVTVGCAGVAWGYWR